MNTKEKMFKEITLDSFKAFQKVSFKPHPLTILVGPNNSGKSSLISVFRLLVQTIESYDPEVPLLLNGELGEFGTYKDIIFNNHGNRRLELKFLFEHDDNEINFFIKFRYRTRRREIVIQKIRVNENGNNLIEIQYSDDAERQLVERVNDKEIDPYLKSDLSDSLSTRNFLPFFFTRDIDNKRESNNNLDTFLKEEDLDAFSKLSKYSRLFMRKLRKSEYIGAIRTSPERNYSYTGARSNRVGAAGENAVKILAIDSARQGSTSKNIEQKVIDWLNNAEVVSDIEIEDISSRNYELKLQHPKTNEYQNYADVGYGNSQVIPVLIGGYNLDEGSTYLVEQPEIHLHPKAQAELGEFFLDLYQRDINSFVETHSPYLIQRLRTLVARGAISNDDICIYYVHASDESKVLKNIKIDDTGQFVDDWPKGFYPERLEESKKLAKARMDS